MLAHAPAQVKPSIPFQFLALPVELLRRNDVSPAAKLLLAVLLDSARGNRSGMSKLCNATLGARIGKSASEAGRHLAELESLGLVRREYGPSKRVRVGVAITWVAEIQGTPKSTSTTSAQPGSANPVNRVQQTSATIQTLPSEPSLQTGEVLEVSGGERRELDPKPSPEVVAATIRGWLGGKHGAKLFEPDPRPLFARVGYAARAAVVHGSPPRKSQDQQLAELAAWRRRQE